MNSIKPEIQEIIHAIEEVLPSCRPIYQNSPYGLREASLIIQDIINSGWVSSGGAEVNQFEQMVADYINIPNTIAVMNGTAALHASLYCLDVKPGDEVICPGLSFVATANAIAYCHAIPHFVDVEQNALSICPDKLELYLAEITKYDYVLKAYINKYTQRPIKGLVVTHTLGFIGQMEKIREICDKYILFMIEDAAQALGSTYNGLHPGSFGDIATLSFNGNKILTTGGGGMIICRCEKLGKRVRHLTTTARISHPWLIEHDHVAFNYRMPNLNAGLGVSQMLQLEKFVEAKRDLNKRYRKAFSSNTEVKLFIEAKNNKSNYWTNAIRVRLGENRDALIHSLCQQKIHTRLLWTPLNTMPMYQGNPSMPLDITTELFLDTICLPSGVGLFLNNDSRASINIKADSLSEKVT